MSAMTETHDGETGGGEQEAVPMARPERRVPLGHCEPGLDLTCTKAAVDLQSVTAENAEERILACVQSLTDACGADAVFIALLDADARQFEKIYAGRSTFSTCNPEVLKGRALADFPWVKARLGHLRLLEIRNTEAPQAL